MIIFIAIMITLAYIVISTVIMYRSEKKLEELAPQGWGSEAPAALTARRNETVIEVGLFILALLALDLVLDNWQTTVTLMLFAVILPAFTKSLGRGAIVFVSVLFAMAIIWQLPSSTKIVERPVDEAVKIATPATNTGHTDAMVVEDHGQYLVTVEDGEGKVVQTSIAAEITKGHYIKSSDTPIVAYHYIERYKRTFWSQQRTKLINKKLVRVDLYVKRDQLLNTF